MPERTTPFYAPAIGCNSLGGRPASGAGRAPCCNTHGAPGTSHRAAAFFWWMRWAVIFFLLVIMGGGTGLGLIAQAQTGPVSPMTSGGLAVIYDAGPGVPTGAFLAAGIADDAPADVSPLIQFPVRSSGLQPGTLQGSPSWPHAQWLVRPLFLMGNDAKSARWLKDNQPGLAALGASGIVVRADSGPEFLRLRALGGGLPMAPAGSRWLSEQLAAVHASVVPLLILPDGRITQKVTAAPPRKGQR